METTDDLAVPEPSLDAIAAAAGLTLQPYPNETWVALDVQTGEEWALRATKLDALTTALSAKQRSYLEGRKALRELGAMVAPLLP